MTMACSQYVKSIQEQVDGTLGAIRRAELDQHLEVCEDCRALLADLERIRDAAGSLGEAPPPDGVWLQIAGRLRQEGRVQAVEPAPRRSWQPAWLAAAAALILAVGGAIYLLYPHQTAPAATTAAATAPAGNPASLESVESVQNELEAAQAQFQTAIGHLEQIAKANRQALDPRTAETIDRNLAITDMAIADSTAAVRAEPTSVAARDALFDALRQKVALLQDTISLINEMRKGNNAGAAQVVNKS
jgi:anti-sigma factor RsiW